MFEIDFPYLTTLVAGVSAFLLGFFWYHPKILGTRWMEARGSVSEGLKPSLRQVILSLLLWLLAASFYSFLAAIIEINELPGYFSLSCLLWVAFTMPPLVMGTFYTGYAFDAVSIDAAYQLAGYYVFAAVHILFGLFG